MSRNHDKYIALLEQIRWGGKPTCPYCGSTNATAYKKEPRYHCNTCFTSYSVTVDTLFHKTHIDLWKWFKAISLVLEGPEGMTVRQLAKEIEVNKNTASYVITRIHKAMKEEPSLLQELLEQSNF